MELYNVTVNYNKEKMTEAEVKENVATNFNEKDVIKLEGYNLELEIAIPEEEGPHEIENEMFYILEAGKLGSYSYKSVE